MSIIGWLILVEAILAVGLLIWYAQHAHHHVKKSPAEEALRRHLAELEAAKLDKKTKPKETAKAQDSSKVKKK